jgi:hypothetical protein
MHNTATISLEIPCMSLILHLMSVSTASASEDEPAVEVAYESLLKNYACKL